MKSRDGYQIMVNFKMSISQDKWTQNNRLQNQINILLIAIIKLFKKVLVAKIEQT